MLQRHSCKIAAATQRYRRSQRKKDPHSSNYCSCWRKPSMKPYPQSAPRSSVPQIRKMNQLNITSTQAVQFATLVSRLLKLGDNCFMTVAATARGLFTHQAAWEDKWSSAANEWSAPIRREPSERIRALQLMITLRFPRILEPEIVKTVSDGQALVNPSVLSPDDRSRYRCRGLGTALAAAFNISSWEDVFLTVPWVHVRSVAPGPDSYELVLNHRCVK